MTNKCCKVCVNTCKQDDSVSIVNCPKFQRKPSDREFRNLLEELDSRETQAKKTQKRVKDLIRNTLTTAPPIEGSSGQGLADVSGVKE